VPLAIELLIQSELRRTLVDIAAQLIRLLLVWTIKSVGGSDPTTVDIATDSRAAKLAQ
jgi:hypothetical protein